MMREIIIDSFAGGGGASEGIRLALGRSPDIAINHDPLALAMHRRNHHETKHLVEDVVSIDAIGMCDGHPVGMVWMSPDCTDHSKAKGGQPRNKNTRGLAWACFGWVKALPKWQRPRVVFLENVEEFEDWGPLLQNGKRSPIQKGVIFKEFVKSWQALGYVVEWRQRRAYISGAGTIRKRLYMIMRRDGEPIVWPEPEFGDPNAAINSANIASGILQPWKTAADSIDFSLPCPSIFDTSEEIKRRFGIRANRPLAENTMARIAKGVKRYVIDAVRPFIVPVTHAGDHRSNGIDEPLRTVTSARRGEHALVVPIVAGLAHGKSGGSRCYEVDEPLTTIHAGGNNHALITPFVTKFNRGATGHRADEPLHTITSAASETHGGGASPLGVVVPHLMTMRNAQKPFSAADEPTHTITAGGANLHAVSAFLVPRYGERDGQEPRTRPVDVPVPVIVPTGNEGSLAAIHLSRQFGASVGSPADEPVGTITAGGSGKTAVVAAFLAQHNYMEPGHDAREPLSTIVSKGSTQGLVAAHLTHSYTSNTRGGEGDLNKPIKTIMAGGQHAATVYAFLAKYFGAGLPSQPCDDPLHTVTAKPRHGVVTVTIAGEPYVIVDIGMRMLTPRERFNAQGFRPDYVIDHGIREDGSIVRFTLEQQGYMCGNSVCPTEARALVGANYRPRDVVPPKRRKPEPMTLFLEAAE